MGFAPRFTVGLPLSRRWRSSACEPSYNLGASSLYATWLFISWRLASLCARWLFLMTNLVERRKAEVQAGEHGLPKIQLPKE